MQGARGWCIGIAVVFSTGLVLWLGVARFRRTESESKAPSASPAGSEEPLAPEELHVRDPADLEEPASPAESRSALGASEPQDAKHETARVVPRTVVRARFVDEGGMPIAGVELRLSDPEFGDAATSGVDGTAKLEIDWTPLGSASEAKLAFEAVRRDFTTERLEVRVSAGEDTPLGDWILVSGASASGTVVDGEGRGLEGAGVACLSDAIHWAEWEGLRLGRLEDLWRPGAKTLSAPDGSFVLTGIPAGEVRLVAVRDGRKAGVSDAIELPPGGLVTDVRIALGPEVASRIAGEVVGPDGAAVAFASVQLRSPRMSLQGQADARGRFDLGPVEGPCEVIAHDPEQRLREARTVDVRPGTVDLVLFLSTAPELELVVLASEGSPVERYAVSMRDAATEEVLYSIPENERPVGIHRLSVPGRDFLIEVFAPGWAPARLGPFKSAEAPERMECRLEIPMGLGGVVLDGERPLAGARVSLHRAVARATLHNGFPVRMEYFERSNATTDARGEFQLSVPEPGLYYLRAEADGRAPGEAGPFELYPGTRRREEVAVGPGGTLEVAVSGQARAEVAGTIVAITRGDGRAQTKRCRGDGILTFTGLTPGRWQAQVVEEEIDPGVHNTQWGTEESGEIPWNCEVFEGLSTRIELWVEDRGALACRLDGRLSIDGKPADGWQVGLDGGALEPLSAPGVFQLSVERPGEYGILLTNSGPEPNDRLVILDRIAFAEGETEWKLDLQTGSLGGTVASSTDTENSLLFHQWERGTLKCLAMIFPDDEGAFHCPRVGAGKGRIVRCDPNAPLEEQEPEILLQVEVKPGGTTVVEIR